MAATRKYPVELRERAVRLYRESDPKPVIAQLARQLNVHPEALRNWIRQDEADRGERHDRPTTEMLEENRRLRAEVKELRAVNDVLKAASAYFASGDRPDPEKVMNFIDAHNFSVGLVLRVLGIPASTYYDWRKARRRAVAASPRGRRAAAVDRRHPRRARVRGHLRLAAGVAGAAPPRRAGGPQARGADHARQRPSRRLPAQGLEARLDPAEPQPHGGPGPVGARLRRPPPRTRSGSRI